MWILARLERGTDQSAARTRTLILLLTPAPYSNICKEYNLIPHKTQNNENSFQSLYEFTQAPKTYFIGYLIFLCVHFFSLLFCFKLIYSQLSFKH